MTTEAPTLEDRLRLLESSVRGIVMEFDASGHYLDVWTHDEALLARPRKELIGATIMEVLGPEAGAPFMELIRLTLAEGRPQRWEYPLEVLAGPRWFSCEGVVGRRPGTVVFLVQDITERKRFDAQLAESERLAAIGLLAGGIGHEINNPLAWLMTNLSTVRGELAARANRGGDEALRQWSEQLGQALEGAERIRQIARDLALFTRGPDEHNAPFDLRAPLDWVADIAMAELRHRARLFKSYKAAPAVTGSEARVGQVFLNLLLNAAQSIEPGNAGDNEVRLELSTAEDGGARIDVVDTGGGIPEQNRSRLFEPFFTTKPRGLGTGLGLLVSRRIIVSMGGSLQLVSSRPGETRFRVSLPAAATSPAKVERPEPPPPAPPRRSRILLIDDHPQFLTSLRLALQHAFEFAEESSARTALERLRRGERFDAIVCDVMMPDLTGMDFHHALTTELPELASKVIFMTGGAYTQRAREFLQATTNGRLEKPFPPEQLAAMLTRLTSNVAQGQAGFGL